MIFVILFYGFWALVVAAGVFVSVGNYLSWKNARGTIPVKKTEPSVNFYIEMNRVLQIIEERMNMGFSRGKGDARKMKGLKDSSEVASLFRMAHYAGYHLTFEQNEIAWSDDPEYLDRNVFKTDLEEAADLREERIWSQYKRYFDPPKSKRERELEKQS